MANSLDNLSSYYLPNTLDGINIISDEVSSSALLVDGTNFMLADLNMNFHNIKNLDAGIDANDAVNLSQLYGVSLSSKLYSDNVSSASRVYSNSVSSASRIFSNSVSSSSYLFSLNVSSSSSLYINNVSSSSKLYTDTMVNNVSSSSFIFATSQSSLKVDKLGDTITGNLALLQNLSIGSSVFYVPLFVSGNSILNGFVTTKGLASSGRVTISEPVGTGANYAYGSLTLEHSDSGGKSSIVFKSNANYGSDYGYIEYRDNYNSTNTENSALIIGVENDATGTAEDKIYFKLNGADRIAINGEGKLGIGTLNPSYMLHVSGGTYINGPFTSTGTVSGDGGVFSDLLLSDSLMVNTSSLLNSVIVTGEMTISSTLTANAPLTLNGGTSSYNSGTVDVANRTNTYLAFGPAGSVNDFAYLRQIGGSDDYHMSLDFHDNSSDGKVSFRNVASSSNPDPNPVTFFKATASRGFYNPNGMYVRNTSFSTAAIILNNEIGKCIVWVYGPNQLNGVVLPDTTNLDAGTTIYVYNCSIQAINVSSYLNLYTIFRNGGNINITTLLSPQGAIFMFDGAQWVGCKKEIANF